MKKRSLLLWLVLVFLPIPVFAESQETTLTTTIPADYTLTIPSKQDVAVNAGKTALPPIKVSGSLAPNQTVKVATVSEAMKNKDNSKAPTLPFSLTDKTERPWSSGTWNAQDAEDEKTVALFLAIDKDAWEQAKPGRYEGKIVFTTSIE